MKTFQEYLEMFQHPAEVPVKIALAVYKIMHNQASADEWELLDKFPRNQVMEWVEKVLVANGVDNVEEEMKWWGSQLRLHDN
jgi:hypothetical protein